MTRATRPEVYTRTAAAVALALALAYLTLQVRSFHHGPILTEGSTSDAEQYTYSAVWLVFGVALLAAGIWYRSLPLRAASAAVVLLTVLKVFVVDMGGLTGIYRALSFLGLGAVLIGIGWFYQRLLFPRPTAAAPRRAGVTRQAPETMVPASAPPGGGNEGSLHGLGLSRACGPVRNWLRLDAEAD